MTLLILSFIAGVLTIAAPCILPLLPIVIGGSLADNKAKPEKQWLRPVIITASLAGSIALFTLLLKASTVLLGIPQSVWQVLSGGIIAALGVSFLFPKFWEQLPIVNRLNLGSNRLLGKSFAQKGTARDVLIGVSLGPVFASCSPTYAFIVATALPASLLTGSLYLLAYVIGLASTLLLVAFAGQSLVAKLRWLSNPNGSFRRILGITFILVGVAIVFGLDKDLQAFILERGWYDPISNLEQRLSK